MSVGKESADVASVAAGSDECSELEGSDCLITVTL